MARISFYLLTAVMAIIVLLMGARPDDPRIVTLGILVGLLAIPWLGLMTTAFAVPLPDQPPPVVHQPNEAVLSSLPPDLAGDILPVAPHDPPLPLGGTREDLGH
ncbi:MAG TPA: hypothetical protein VEI97_02135 [bacterium]|nr:hypothetical protein [bacterium]